MKHPFLFASLLVVACLAVFVPTLGSLPFQNPMERLAIGSAVETAREGDWIMPQFEGHPRVNKPPLQTWLSMPLLRTQTLTRLSDPAPATRQAAYQSLAWHVRLLPVLVNCLLVGAVFGLALQFGPPRYALLAALIGVSNALFLDHVRLASYDPALATWIAFTNFFLALAIFKGRLWLGCVMAAAFLSLAFLTKGPVALLQTVLPALLFLAWRHLVPPAPAAAAEEVRHRGRIWMPLLAASAIFCALSIPWFVYFVGHNPDAFREWYRQIFRDLPSNKPDPAHTYIRILVWMLPWTPWLVIGAVVAAVHAWRRRNHALVFPFFLMAVPLVIMTCFPHRTERYLVPLIPSFALLAAGPLQRVLDRLAAGFRDAKPWRMFMHVRGKEVTASSFNGFLLLMQWGIILAAALFVPLYGRWFARTLAGDPWFSLTTTIAAIAVTLGVVGMAIVLQRRWVWSLVAAGVFLTGAGNFLYLSGWQSSAKGTPEALPLADAIADAYPPPIAVYCILPADRHPPSEMLVYLNRVVITVDAPEKIPADGVAKVILTTRPANQRHVPPPPLAGARHLAESPLGSEILDGFALPGVGH